MRSTLVQVLSIVAFWTIFVLSPEIGVILLLGGAALASFGVLVLYILQKFFYAPPDDRKEIV